MIGRLLAHPLSRGTDLDDPRSTVIRRRILSEKKFLREIYKEWYAFITESLGGVSDSVLELGSGAGFLREFLPDLITSDLLQLPDLSLALDACYIPFRDDSLSSIVMIDVLHHLPQPRRFFDEASRCVRRGGRIVMIEPWVTPWSWFVFGILRQEPFDPERKEWEFPSTGPLSGANGAIPWMLFHRDYERFSSEYPQWRLENVMLDMPASFLVSGGLSFRSLAPGAAYKTVRWMERRARPWMDKIAMFAYITLTKVA